MTPTYKNIHLKFKVNGFHYSSEYLKELAYDFVKEGKPFEKEIGNFLFQWLDENETIKVRTSGSTGTPKVIELSKQAMVNSALATGDFFKLQPGDRALLCLPATYIAGKMMLVRAIILGLEIDIVEPASKLQFDTQKVYDFCAMVPMQLEKALDTIDHIKTIIVGGAPASSSLKANLQQVQTKVYETYGMTETVTHIALKAINNTSVSKPNFKVLPGVTISQDERDCLVVEAPKLCQGKIVTNDMVKIHSESEFEWLGRFDNVINSGGVKLFPEQIEAKLQHKINSRFFIASEPNDILGEQLILVVESESNDLNSEVFSDLDKFEKPKAVYMVKEFVETTSGKIQRKKTLEIIKK
ncbi:AMP-binding protein [Aestuariibaculum suncheonense]|uniref:AMP-binding protein n=1 Tax=Aestuariibaculum suncheonense TaxID=1028745 RepID=A0A8J6UGS2_9FLAO|nr:AMP-binding protein [Aestuariibaculum suncheonense]MBD0835319.1 AMP-binding protein [Aestuariibaculum suncheonense]